MEMEKRNKWKRLCIKAAISLLLGLAAARWGIPYVLAQRGYPAVGGEYLLILIAAALPFFLSPELWRR